MRVDFYLLNNAEPKSAEIVACRLIEKAYQRGHRVFVFCEDAQAAARLDELLWTYKDDSFIPHNLQGEGPEPPPPVQIGYGPEPRGFNDILLNLSTTIPPYFSRFRRVMEVIASNDAAKDIGRNHYREYRSKQCDLHTHNLLDNVD